MRKKNYGILASALLCSILSYGQDTTYLSRNEVIEKVAEKNLQLKINEKTYQTAKANYEQSNALFLPNITLSHTGISTTNPLMAFGSRLNQAIVTSSDFDPMLLNNPKRTQNFATMIEIQQPIVNMDGMYGRLAAKAEMEAYLLKNERTKEYLAFEISTAYMQLQLSYRYVKVMEIAEATGKANLKLVEDYFNQGLLQKPDWLNVQVRVSEIEGQLKSARSNVFNASDYLAFLLNENNTGKVYKPTEELENTIAVESMPSILSDKRKDILAMNKSTNAYQKMYTSSKLYFLPRLNAFGSYQLYDKNLFGISAKGYLIGAQLSWNVFDGYKSIGKLHKTKAEFQKAEVELEQYKMKGQLEINKTNRQLLDAENKVNLSKSALEHSQEVYRIRQNRFTQGLEKTTDLLQSEIQMIQKEIEYLQSVYEFNYTKHYLQFLTK